MEEGVGGTGTGGIRSGVGMEGESLGETTGIESGGLGMAGHLGVELET